jgi:hypothetical protein
VQPKYIEEDFDRFILWKDKKSDSEICKEHKTLIVSLANFLYKIDLNDQDKKLLWKSLRKNQELRKSVNISKKDFSIDIIDVALEALNYKYESNEFIREYVQG